MLSLLSNYSARPVSADHLPRDAWLRNHQFNNTKGFDTEIRDMTYTKEVGGAVGKHVETGSDQGSVPGVVE